MTPEEWEDEMDRPRPFNGHAGTGSDRLANGCMWVVATVVLGLFGIGVAAVITYFVSETVEHFTP